MQVLAVSQELVVTALQIVLLLHRARSTMLNDSRRIYNLRAFTIARICSSCFSAFSFKTWLLTESLATSKSNCSLGSSTIRWNKHLKSCSAQPKLAKGHPRPTRDRMDYVQEARYFGLRFDPGPSAMLKRGGKWRLHAGSFMTAENARLR